MKTSLVEKIADAVLYEGYILYPYRPSAVKNQQRWNFGALCPESYSVAQRGTENWTMQTECLVQTKPGTVVNIRVRFLHLLERQVAEPDPGCQSDLTVCGHQHFGTSNLHYAIVPSLEVNGKRVQTWQEAVERRAFVPAFQLGKDNAETTRTLFLFPASESIEQLLDETSGKTAGVLVRKQQGIEGAVDVTAVRMAGNVTKLNVQILNLTAFKSAGENNRDEALMRSFVSTHTILNLDQGEFVSLLDPPDNCRDAAASCNNVGTYPVLVGEEGARDCMLSSPIILYDYPQIAPESAGNLYDGTEIDEILTLRIMTLTDEEKREMRDADDRGRQILERTEMLPAEQLLKMHGAMKGVKKGQ
jgi:hypothetical protein